jgi:transcriptional regulator with XRE-family HTH domain
MDPVRLGHAFRALRIRRRWRQEDLALTVGISRSAISRIERGRIGPMTLSKLRRVSEALDAELDVRLRWNGEGLDRLLDQAHAGIVEILVERLQAAGWEVDVETSFAIGGERGSIDVVACFPELGMVMVVEVKSVVPDSQATIHGLDRKARLAPQIARSRGWECRGVSRLLVIGDTATSRRRIAQLSSTYRVAYPTVGRAVLTWLRAPAYPISGLLFMPFARPTNVSKGTTGVQRVRVPKRPSGRIKRAREERMNPSESRTESSVHPVVV